MASVFFCGCCLQLRFTFEAICSRKLRERQTKIHKTIDKVRPLY